MEVHSGKVTRSRGRESGFSFSNAGWSILSLLSTLAPSDIRLAPRETTLKWESSVEVVDPRGSCLLASILGNRASAAADVSSAFDTQRNRESREDSATEKFSRPRPGCQPHTLWTARRRAEEFERGCFCALLLQADHKGSQSSTRAQIPSSGENGEITSFAGRG